jgi:hypothetical protein
MRFISATVTVSLFALVAASCGGSPTTPDPVTTIPAGTHQSAIVSKSSPYPVGHARCRVRGPRNQAVSVAGFRSSGKVTAPGRAIAA